MTLYNAFASLALDQSVMCTTPLLKAINTTLQSTPYVYVVNPGATAITSTPVVSLANTQVTVQNFPTIYPTQGVVNVNVANTTTPPDVQNVNIINVVATPIIYSYQPAPYYVSETSTPNVQLTGWPTGVANVALVSTPIVQAQFINNFLTVADISTPTVRAFISNMPPISVTSTAPPMQNVNWASQATPVIVTFAGNVSGQTTPVVSAIITNMPPVVANVAAAPMQNVNFASQATPVQVSFNNTPGQATPVVSAVISNMPPISVTANPPAMQNVNFASQATPVQIAFGTWAGQATPTVAITGWPSTQNIVLTSTPVVSLANSQVTVQNFPATQNVLVTNFATPQPVSIYQQATPLQVSVTSHSATPVVQAQLSNNIFNVQPVSLSTPIVIAQPGLGVYNTTLISTPVVSLANTQVTVQNFPAIYPTQGVVNVNVANQTTPAILATPIVYAYQPSPYYVTGTVTANVTFPNTQNVLVTNFATPQYVSILQQATPLQVSVTSFTATPVVEAVLANAQIPVSMSQFTTPIVISQPGIGIYNTSITSTPNVELTGWPLGVGNVALVSTPVVSAFISNMPPISVTANPPAMQNVNFAEQATPVIVTFAGNVAGQTTPIVFAQLANQVQNNYITNTAGPTGSTLQAVPVNVVQAATPVYVNIQNVVSTPIVAIEASSSTMGPQNSIKVQDIIQAGQAFTDNTGAFQPQQDLTINVSNIGSATPLVLAASKQIRVLNYAISASAACVVTFTATPLSNIANIYFQPTTGIPRALINSAIQGGPFFMGANTTVAFSGSLTGEAFTIPAATPLYIQASTGSVGGHFVFVYV